MYITTAIVLKRCREPRSFIIKTEDGHTYRRNRKYVRQNKTEPIIPDELIIVSDDNSNESFNEGVSQGETNKTKELVELLEEIESQGKVRTKARRVSR